MKKLQVSLPDTLRDQLDAAVAKSGRSLGEEIRLCIQRAYSQQLDPPTQRLLHLIGALAVGTERQMGRPWHAHPAAHFVFQRAVEILLVQRKPEGELALPSSLPADRPVAVTTDLEAMAVGLAVLISHAPPQDIGQIDRQFGTPPVLRQAARPRKPKQEE
jgi:hypothetical protein